MAVRTQATAFTRFLFVIAFMAALFFFVQYALTNTEWGKQLHQDIQEAAPMEQNG